MDQHTAILSTSLNWDYSLSGRSHGSKVINTSHHKRGLKCEAANRFNIIASRNSNIKL